MAPRSMGPVGHVPPRPMQAPAPAPINGAATPWTCPPPDTVPHPLASLDAATRDAYLDGRDEGERAGYVAGWRWGAACGAFGGMAACALLAFALGLIVGVR